MNIKLKQIIINAYMCGYEKGHFDTVEGMYGHIEEKADEYFAELRAEISKKRENASNDNSVILR